MQWKITKLSLQKVVAVAHERLPFTTAFTNRVLTGKILVFWVCGSLWEEVAHGGSTVLDTWYSLIFTTA